MIGDAERLQEKISGYLLWEAYPFSRVLHGSAGNISRAASVSESETAWRRLEQCHGADGGASGCDLPACDVAYNVGGEFTVTTEEEMVDAVIRYASDDVFYAQKKQIAIEKGRDGGEQKMLEYVTSLFTRIQENVE